MVSAARNAIRNCLRNVCYVCELALAGTVPSAATVLLVMLWDSNRRAWGLVNEIDYAMYKADNLKLDPVIIGNKTLEGRFKQMCGAVPAFYLCFVGFFPFVLRFYLTRNSFSYFWFGLSFLCYFLVLFGGYAYLGVGSVITFNPLIALLFHALALKASLPGTSKIHQKVSYQFWILIFGVGVLQSLQFYPLDSDMGKLIMFCFILPLVREVSRFLAVRSAWYLSSDKHVGGDGVKVERVHAWVFVGWIQLIFAIYFRLAIANLSDLALAWFVVIWQAVLEIILRLTVKKRDVKILIARDRAISLIPRRVSSVTPVKKQKTEPLPVLLVGSKKNHTVTGMDPEKLRVLSKSTFYALLIQTEMIAEYSGIVISCLALSFWRTRPLETPFFWYASKPLDQIPDISTVVRTSVLQYFAEIFVDVICVTFEGREVEPKKIWRELPKRPFFALFMFAPWYAYICAQAFFTNSDNFSKCLGQDICLCLNQGLTPDGVLHKYCELLISKGHVPNATVPSG